jgi:hypothetical protein
VIVTAGRGRLSTVDLLVLTSLDWLLLTMQTLFTFFYKTSYLNEEVNGTEQSPSVSFPWWQTHLLHRSLITRYLEKTG